MKKLLLVLTLLASMSSFASQSAKVCVEKMNSETRLTATQSRDFCIEVESNEEVQDCVVKMNSETRLTATQSRDFCIN